MGARMRGRWGLISGLAVVAVVASALPALAAAPGAPSNLTFERAVTYSPVLAATISDPDGGAVSGMFFARRAGSSTWDLLNGVPVAVSSGQTARAQLPAVPAGTSVQWQVKACDASTCSGLSVLTTSLVSPMLGAGPRKNQTAQSFPAGDRVKSQVDVGTGD